MTGPDLREHLDDLLHDVPAYVEPDPRTAWAAGARRRTRHRAGLLAAAAAVVALFSALVVTLQHREPGPASGGDGVGSYPARIDRPLWTRSWHDVDRVASGLLLRPDGWWLVAPDGGLARMDGAGTQVSPVLSPDGTQVAWLDTQYGQATVEVTDLTTRATTGSDADLASERSPWVVPPGARLVWSPDSSEVLVPVRPRPDTGRPGIAALLMRVSGPSSAVRAPSVTADHLVAAGWQGRDTLVWVAWDGGPGASATDLRVLLGDLRGRVRQTLPLSLDGAAGHLDETSVSVSPEGNVLALGTDGAAGDPVRFFGLRGPMAGKAKATMPAVADAAAGCPASWSDALEVPTAGSDRDALLVSVNGGATVLADPGLEVSCATWAAQALSGRTHEGLGTMLFGERTSWLSWHWREVGLGVLGAVLLAGGAALVVRRRRLSG